MNQHLPQNFFIYLSQSIARYFLLLKVKCLYNDSTQLLPTPLDLLLEGANKTFNIHHSQKRHLLHFNWGNFSFCPRIFKLAFYSNYQKNSALMYLKMWKLFCPRLTRHHILCVLPNKHQQLTGTVGFGPILLFPLRHQQSPLTSTAIWEQTQPSNSTGFCHPDVERATQRRAAGRHK